MCCEIHGHQEQSNGDEIRPFGIEPGGQSGRKQPANQSAGRNGVSNIREVPEHKQRGQRDKQKRKANELGDRRFHRAAAEPRIPDEQQTGRQQECRIAEPLKEQVGQMRADRTNPIARRPLGSGDVKRRIARRIGKQAQRDEDRRRDPQESDELVEAAVSRWSE